MLCKDCEYGAIYIDFSKDNHYENGKIGVSCEKYHLICDTTHPEIRQCIKEDCDVLWRAARCRLDGEL